MQRIVRLVVSVVCAAVLGACASYNTARPNPANTNAPVYSEGRGVNSAPQSVAYGQVRSIEPIGIGKDQPQGAGAVVGGLVGAVVGRQFSDNRRSENVGMVAGAVAGAVIGNEIEKNARREQTGVRITVTLDYGGTRSFDFRDAGPLRVGDRVRIEGSQLYRL